MLQNQLPDLFGRLLNRIRYTPTDSSRRTKSTTVAFHLCEPSQRQASSNMHVQLAHGCPFPAELQAVQRWSRRKGVRHGGADTSQAQVTQLRETCQQGSQGWAIDASRQADGLQAHGGSEQLKRLGMVGWGCGLLP